MHLTSEAESRSSYHMNDILPGSQHVLLQPDQRRRMLISIQGQQDGSAACMSACNWGHLLCSHLQPLLIRYAIFVQAGVLTTSPHPIQSHLTSWTMFAAIALI